MAKSTSDTGLFETSARAAHGFLRDQVLAILAPVYLFRYRRASDNADVVVAASAPCGSNPAIDLHPTGIGRS